MNPNLQGLIDRLEDAEREHQRRLNSHNWITKTNRQIRRQYLAHRSFSHGHDERQAAEGVSLAERAWLGWTQLKWRIEIALAHMRDQEDRNLLQNRNQLKFGAPSAPSI